ncbi:MAG: DUF1194 domain-containing protein [Bauldia sp.]|nr:DUF1194 domain-containing protein [Bauldia sp.]
MRASRSFVRLATLAAAAGFLSVGGWSLEAWADDLTEVDVQLVLAADVSGSMGNDEMRLQRDGHVEALRSPDVLSAITSGPLGRVAVSYVEWAGPRTQNVVVPWTVLSDRESVRAFTERLAMAPLRNSGSGTSVSGGLLFSAALFEVSGFRSYRRIIDISGDGVSDQGPPITDARDEVVGHHIVINGLSIQFEDIGSEGPYAYFHERDKEDVHAYYRDRVIGGPGAFAISVDKPESFVTALRRKLVLEIARGPALPKQMAALLLHDD